MSWRTSSGTRVQLPVTGGCSSQSQGGVTRSHRGCSLVLSHHLLYLPIHALGPTVMTTAGVYCRWPYRKLISIDKLLGTLLEEPPSDPMEAEVSHDSWGITAWAVICMHLCAPSSY